MSGNKILGFMSLFLIYCSSVYSAQSVDQQVDKIGNWLKGIEPVNTISDLGSLDGDLNMDHLMDEDDDKVSSLYLAILNNEVVKTKEILGSGLNITQSEKTLVLWIAAKCGNNSIFNILLNNGFVSAYSFDDLKTMLKPSAQLTQREIDYIRSVVLSFDSTASLAGLREIVINFGSILKKINLVRDILKVLGQYDARFPYENIILGLLPQLVANELVTIKETMFYLKNWTNRSESNFSNENTTVQKLLPLFARGICDPSDETRVDAIFVINKLISQKMISMDEVFLLLNQGMKSLNYAVIDETTDEILLLIKNKLITIDQVCSFAYHVISENNMMFVWNMAFTAFMYSDKAIESQKQYFSLVSYLVKEKMMKDRMTKISVIVLPTLEKLMKELHDFSGVRAYCLDIFNLLIKKKVITSYFVIEWISRKFLYDDDNGDGVYYIGHYIFLLFKILVNLISNGSITVEDAHYFIEEVMLYGDEKDQDEALQFIVSLADKKMITQVDIEFFKKIAGHSLINQVTKQKLEELISKIEESMPRQEVAEVSNHQIVQKQEMPVRMERQQSVEAPTQLRQEQSQEYKGSQASRGIDILRSHYAAKP